MTQRKQISKKMRFEVLKRDKFTCQYCGKKAPDVILHIDHIKPVKSGGKNTMLNLVTSCVGCNLGKGAKELSDDSEIKKQERELSMLAEKQEQVKLMIKWREQLCDTNELMIDSARKVINSHLSTLNHSISEHGLKAIKSNIYKGKYTDVMDSIENAKAKHPHIETECDAISFIDLCGKITRIETDPVRKKLNYAKGILRNRLAYFDERKYYTMVSWVDDPEIAEEIIQLSKIAKNWTDIRNLIDELYEGDSNG